VNGTAQLVYTPPVTNAAPGDSVAFLFMAKNHTVTQSAFATPCTPLEGGFFSGFNPVSPNETHNFPGFVVPVTDTKPIWFYCSQTGHCPQGMVGAINPPTSGNTFTKFKQEALTLANSTSTSTPPPPTSGNTTTIAGHCPLNRDTIDFPAGSTIGVPAGQNPEFITIGRGTQNYTCHNGTFASVGAVAELFDISCLFTDFALFKSIEDIALLLPRSNFANTTAALAHFNRSDVDTVSSILTSRQLLLGHHFFSDFPAGSSTIEPEFDFTEALNNPTQFIISNKTAQIPDPRNATANVAWLQLANLTGSLAKSVFRVDTAGGVQPTSCTTEGQNIEVEYAAKYWFFK